MMSATTTNGQCRLLHMNRFEGGEAVQGTTEQQAACELALGIKILRSATKAKSTV